MSDPSHDDTPRGGWGPLTPLGEALRFLTVLPTPGMAPPSAEGMLDGVRAFPLAGWVIGGFGALWALLLGPFLSPDLLAWGVLAAWFLVNRGLHLDGIADVSDAVFSSRTRERMLEILKDSRIGTMGALSLIFVLAGQWMALSDTGRDLWIAALAAPALGRGTSLYGMRRFPPLGESGLGAQLRLAAKTPDVLLWALVTLVIPLALVVGPIPAGLAILACILTAEIAGGALVRTLGGLSGDGYGVLVELGQLAALLVWAATL